MVDKMFNGMFGRIGSGLCRLTVNGDIAVKTSDGYKSYNVKKGILTNCANFVFNIGEEFFFVIPTNKVTKGDIVLIGGRPKCVIDAEKNKITAIDYESSEIKTIIPERHIFFGKTYFYGKIVSMFGSANFMKGKNGINRMMQFMVMSEMMKGMAGNSGNGVKVPALTDGNMGVMTQMLPFMMMGGMNMGNMFEGMFDFNFDDDDDDSEDSEVIDVESSDESDDKNAEI